MFGFEKIERDKVANRLIQHIGLHPLVALGVIGVDMMLFTSDALGPIGWLISTIVGLLLLIPAIIMQKYAYRDSWLVAVAKGIIVGLLTAIPTPLPAFLTGASGILGAIGTFKSDSDIETNGNKPEIKSEQKIIDADVIDVDAKEVPPSPEKDERAEG